MEKLIIFPETENEKSTPAWEAYQQWVKNNPNLQIIYRNVIYNPDTALIKIFIWYEQLQ